jgi:hypothetical protein
VSAMFAECMNSVVRRRLDVIVVSGTRRVISVFYQVAGRRSATGCLNAGSPPTPGMNRIFMSVTQPSGDSEPPKGKRQPLVVERPTANGEQCACNPDTPHRTFVPDTPPLSG